MYDNFKDFDCKIIKKRLKKIANNATQKEIAEKLNISPTSLSNKLSGKVEITLSDLLGIVTAYNCSLDYLLGLSEKKEQEETKREYVTFSDFARDLLAICENEDHTIKHTGEFPREVYPLVFNNPQINSFLANFRALEQLKKDPNYSNLYENWKSGILKNNMSNYKKYDYQDLRTVAENVEQKIKDDRNDVMFGFKHESVISKEEKWAVKEYTRLNGPNYYNDYLEQYESDLQNRGDSPDF